MQNRMYRVACAYLRGEHDRLDAVSQAILRAWEKHGGLRQPQYFDTWLIRILIRECIAIQRRQARVIPMDTLPDMPAPESPADTPLALREALSRLPEKLRVVLALYYMEGFNVAEISRILRISTGAVCSRLSRGSNARHAQGGNRMKREDWQAAYEPIPTALHTRVSSTLSQLDKEEKVMKRTIIRTLALALCAALLLCCTALALVNSDILKYLSGYNAELNEDQQRLLQSDFEQKTIQLGDVQVTLKEILADGYVWAIALE